MTRRQTMIALDQKHYDWLRANHIKISEFVRCLIDERMETWTPKEVKKRNMKEIEHEEQTLFTQKM